MLMTDWARSTVWAMLPDRLHAMMDLMAMQDAHAGQSTEITAAARRSAVMSGALAVLPLSGPISYRGGGGLFAFLFGGATVEQFTRDFRQAMADPAVGAVLLDIDSPGGEVSGIDELSAEIFNARGSKPIVAIANSMAASAAYWIATAADEVVTIPTGEVGSIGVFAAHFDYSAMMANDGVKATLISAGKFKTEGNRYEPLSEEAQKAMQARVDSYYQMFVNAVARNRGVSAEDVMNGFGEGRVLGAAAAKKAKMV